MTIIYGYHSLISKLNGKSWSDFKICYDDSEWELIPNYSKIDNMGISS